MSELKAYTLFTTSSLSGQRVYLKSEADKVIADLEESHKMEVEQLLMEIVKLKEAFKNADELNQKRKSYETATFYRMISRYEYSSVYGTNGENCIEDFASNITFCHTPNKYWKLVKGGKTIAREAIYLGE